MKTATPTGERLTVDPIKCTGHGVCAELLPELIERDEWGYPIIAKQDIPRQLRRSARQAVAGCPVLALSLVRREPK